MWVHREMLEFLLVANWRHRCRSLGGSAHGSIPDKISMKADIGIFMTGLARQTGVATDAL
jgi:hypothetical protein